MKFNNYITEASTKDATDMELSIVQAWNGEELKRPDQLEAATKIVAALKQQGVTGVAKHWGSAAGPLTKEWKEWGGVDNTPKTDLSIGDFDISLKKEGASQLMSGGNNETNAVLHAALQNDKIRKEMQPFIDEIERFSENLIKTRSKFNVSQLRKEVDAEQADVDIKEIDAKVQNAKKSIKKFTQSDNFKTAIVFEAATGLAKFGGSFATASHIMVFGMDGSWVKLNSLEDPAFITKLSRKTKVDVRFKSISSTTKARGKEYNIYSALRMDTKTLKEELEKYDDNMLTEGKLQNIFKKVIEKMKKYWSEVKAWLKESVYNIFTFLGLDISLSVGETTF